LRNKLKKTTVRNKKLKGKSKRPHTEIHTAGKHSLRRIQNNPKLAEKRLETLKIIQPRKSIKIKSLRMRWKTKNINMTSSTLNESSPWEIMLLELSPRICTFQKMN
jgi:hypothetical protein